MKANKVKTSVKDVKKKTKRVVKKQLETTISDKFFEAMNSLGHDAENFSKEIKKTSKALAKKIEELSRNQIRLDELAMLGSEFARKHLDPEVGRAKYRN